MTISSTTNTVSYTGNGSTTEFAVNYVFFGTGTSAEIQVVEVVIATGAESVKSNGSDFTVSGGNGATGTVTAAVAPASTVKWVINRTTTQTQETDYVENDPFPAESHEEALDRLTAVDQEQQRALDRTAQLPDGYTGSFDPTLPVDVTGSTVLAFNAGATAFEVGPTTSEISNAQTYATNAASSATEAAASAAAAAYGGSVAVDSFVDVTDYTSGTTTQLTLANDPGSEQNIVVTFDGITQHHATYSISGTTITFTSAIPIGTDNVEVRYNDAFVISVPADGSVTNAKMSYPLTGLTSQYHRVSGTPLGVDVASDIYATSVSDTNKELGLQVGMTAVKGKPNQTTAWNMAAQFSTICSDATSGTGSGDIYGINTVVHAPAGTLLVVGSEVDVNNTGADAETLGAATSAYSNVAVLGGTYIGTAAYYATTSNNTWKYGFAAKTTGVYKTKTLSYVTGWVERGLDLADGTFTTDIDSTTGLSQVVYANAGTQTIVLTGDTWHKDLSAGDTVRPIGSTSNNTLFTVVTRDSDTAITVTGGTVNETDAVPISRIVQTGVGIGVALPNRIPIVGTNNAGSAEVEIVKLNATDSVEFGAPTINPLQPAFSVQRSSSSGGVTGAGGAYQVVFNQENFDQDSSMTTTTFTAKVAGIYSFVARVHLIGLTAAADNMTLKIITSGSAVDPQYTEVNTNDLDTQQSIEVSGLLNLAVGDTAYVQLTVTGEANDTTVSVFGSAAVGYSSFTGYLVA